MHSLMKVNINLKDGLFNIIGKTLDVLVTPLVIGLLTGVDKGVGDLVRKMDRKGRQREGRKLGEGCSRYLIANNYI
ncbi:hypothetical protein CEXT_241911 [Caerostris extrusa]|uniref:Uncharacterized protein n=1 Tax=Caerostris extrusa TaxID=172846 RepID=A0AAV4WJJ4_CAEEX|nr:hypothetical protein CEXT_241911 [Caerostris extrusa]